MARAPGPHQQRTPPNSSYFISDSAAAYELRCQRRKARDRENQRLQIVRTGQHHGSASDSTHSSSRFKNSTVPAGALSATASAFFSS